MGDTDHAMSTQVDSGSGRTAWRHREGLTQQLREQGIHNEEVLQAILETPRHCFISDAVSGHAYKNMALPIGFQQTISQPYVVARMTEALVEPNRPKIVLEIGTGSGYQAAVLSKLVNQVYTIERISDLYEEARQRLKKLGCINVRTKLGDGGLGWSPTSVFDGIIVTAASPELPQALQNQLAVGGRLVIPEGHPHQVQSLACYTCTEDGLDREKLLDVMFVPLVSSGNS